MTNRERENATLSFLRPDHRGAVEETFYPWTLTVERFIQEGLPLQVWGRKETGIINGHDTDVKNFEKYFSTAWGESILDYERFLGFDPVRRASFTLPFRRYEDEVPGDSKYIVACEENWQVLKEHGDRILAEYFTDNNIKTAYSHLSEGHQRGDYSIRINLEGFFWTPRGLMGIEPHMYAFYDYPDLIHDINEYILKVYLEKFTKVLEIIPADVVYIMEDLSGKNGPMLSPGLFDEFIGSYYRRLIPVLKSKGVRHVFVDTDGDFKAIIPNFLEAGVEGFLPMDVNAGMDIVAVRKEFPKLKFIGGYNKLCIAEGREAIEREFERLMPVIRQGGYIPGADHQVAPSTSLENYRYYISKLKEAMHQAGAEL